MSEVEHIILSGVTRFVTSPNYCSAIKGVDRFLDYASMQSTRDGRIFAGWECPIGSAKLGVP